MATPESLSLSDAEPALHRRVAIPGPQRPVVGDRRAEVPGVDIGCGVGRAQRCVSSVRRRMVDLCSLCNLAERPHLGGPWVEVAVMTRDDELGVAGARGVLCRTVSWDAAQSALCSRLSLYVVGDGSDIPKRVPGVLPSRTQAVLEPSQGHLVDYLRRARGDPRGPLAIRVLQEVEDDFGVHRMDPWPVGAVLQGEGGGHPLPVGHRA